jgi:hypothetical protein
MAMVNHSARARDKERTATFKSRKKDMGASLDEVGYQCCTERRKQSC